MTIKIAEEAANGHGEPCYYCGEPCNSLAGDPGLWPIPLAHKDDPGCVKRHHIRCVSERLIENLAPSSEDGAWARWHNTSVEDLGEFYTRWLERLTGHGLSKADVATVLSLLELEAVGERAKARDADRRRAAPIQMILHCPLCGTQHVDAPNAADGWSNPPHRSHKCGSCGTIWRPADVATEGVEKIQTRGKGDTWNGEVVVPGQRHWVYAATEACRDLVNLVPDGAEYWNREHLIDMMRKIPSLSPTKANRWLGWIQACICFYRVATLQDLKEINRKEADRAAPSV